MALVGSLTDLPVDLVRVDPADRTPVINWLSAQAGVRSVQPDTIEGPDSEVCKPGSGCEIPDDPGLPYQWYVYNAPGNPPPPGGGAVTFGVDVDAPLAWSHTLGSDTVRIAIVDSGIDAGQPDLAGKMTAAANFTATTGDCADVADGIVWATDHGANVINMSLGSSSPCQAMALAVDYAFAHAALPIAAAGNDGTTVRSYPAAYDHVLSVAATDPGDRLAGFSNRDADWVDVAAPGVGIVSTLPTYANATGAIGYGYLSGTSMAAPIVSGIAALIWNQMPAGQANQAVEARIFASGQAITGTGTDFRYGRVDACRAVTADTGPCSGLEPTPAPAPSTGTRSPTAQRSPIARPAPVGPLPSAAATAGLYGGSLDRRGGQLRLNVADGGDAVIRIQATVRLRCQGGVARRVRIGGLSASRYGRIAPSGRFAFTVRVRSGVLRRLQLQAKGRFDVAGRRGTGRPARDGIEPAERPLR